MVMMYNSIDAYNRLDITRNCAKIVRLCKQHGVRVVVNSDAHYHEHVGVMDHAVDLLAREEFPRELIVNSSRESFELFLQEKETRTLLVYYEVSVHSIGSGFGGSRICFIWKLRLGSGELILVPHLTAWRILTF